MESEMKNNQKPILRV